MYHMSMGYYTELSIFLHLRILLFHTLAIDEIKVEIALALKSHDFACANSAKFIEKDGMNRLAICGRQMINNSACVMMDEFCKLTLWTFRLISNFNGIHSDIFDLDLLGQAELVAQWSTAECSTWLFVLFTWHVFFWKWYNLPNTAASSPLTFFAILSLAMITYQYTYSSFWFWSRG